MGHPEASHGVMPFTPSWDTVDFHRYLRTSSSSVVHYLDLRLVPSGPVSSRHRPLLRDRQPDNGERIAVVCLAANAPQCPLNVEDLRR